MTPGLWFWVRCALALIPTVSILGVEAFAQPDAKSSCCEFPIRQRPTESYLTNPRNFGAARANGRLHSACDLYRPSEGEEIISIEDGKVIRGPYLFYQGTYAIEVKHASGFVVRYGEVSSKKAAGVKTGAKITKGQVIGYMGKVNSNCCSPMLNFEIFSGKTTGPLTQNRKPYQRRKDLLDPTQYLQNWEQQTFGSHSTQTFSGLEITETALPSITSIREFSAQTEIQNTLIMLVTAGLKSKTLNEITLGLLAQNFKTESFSESSEETGTFFELNATSTRTDSISQVHAQFFGSGPSDPGALLQHLSIETDGSLVDARTNLEGLVGNRIGPDTENENFVQWLLPNGYVLWMENINADSASNNSRLRAVIELSP